MLPSSERLSAEQFKTVMEKGRVTNSSLFLLRVYKDNSINHARVSAVASQKIAKTAVMRNSLRRKVYEAVSPFFGKIERNTHSAIFIKAGASKIPFADLQKAAEEIFDKAGILK